MAENEAGQNWWERTGQNAAAGYGLGEPAEKPEFKQVQDSAKQAYGSTKPGDIAKQLVLSDLEKYRQAPETFGLSEGEKQAAADKAAAASGAAMATGLAKGTREMMGGGTTGYASQALRESTAPTRQAAASASQQALETSRRMIEQKGENLYRSLTGQPTIPSLGQQMLAAGGTAALTAGGTALGDYIGTYLGGDEAAPAATDAVTPSGIPKEYDIFNPPGM